LRKIAQSKGISVSALALAWLQAQGDDIIPISGTTKPKNLDANIQALSVDLTPEENTRIRTVVETAGVAGGRYHAA
jgi:aryl-alcohol dehydrogenase-like predicted oxidoreductase